MGKRPFDIIVYGATGFTGKLVVEYLLQNYGLKNDLFNWAIAGRSLKKLEKLKTGLSEEYIEAKDIKIFVADSYDIVSIEKLSKSAKVIISTVGPYIRYGINLVSVCAHNGTHYCDLTGEVPFIRESIDAYDGIANNNKSKIIHSCGFDSIPSDLGVLFLQSEAIKKYNSSLNQIKYYVKGTKGGLSGGTIASMIAISKYIKSKPNLSGLLGNSYALNSAGYNGPPIQSLRSVDWDEDIQSWLAPFIMSGINTRIVRRSNELLDFKYGKKFKYSEFTSYPKGLKGYIRSYLMLISLGLTKMLMSVRPTLWFLRKFFLPLPGEGPSKERRENGYFKVFLNGYVGKNQLSCTVTGNRDPGYSGTAIMLTESSLSLILEKDKITQKFGVLTPASGIGKVLINRLNKKGIVFEIS